MRQGAAGVGHTYHLFGGTQANHIGPDTASSVLGSTPAREEDRVTVLYSGLDAHGLQIRRYRLRQWGNLRLGKLGKRPDLDGQGTRRIAGFLQQFLRPGGVVAIELVEVLRPGRIVALQKGSQSTHVHRLALVAKEMRTH